MKVIELISENFKRLNAHVVMDGKNVTVEGKNGVGKSSFIDAIWVALTGKDVPEQPIQQGKDSAKIAVTVKGDDDSQFIVERKFTAAGTALTVKTQDGAKFSSPQRFLDQKLGCISFDPFEFIHKQPREQKKFLMELLGIDLTEIDSTKKALLAQKDELTKQHQALKSEIDKLPAITEELEEKSTAEAIKRYNDRLDDIKEIKEKRNRWNYLINESNDISIKIQELQKKLKEMNEEIEKLKLENLEEPEIGDLQAEIEAINAHNEKVKQQKITRLKIGQLNSITAKGKAKVEEIKKLEEERVRVITSAKMPINGLSFGDEGLLFEGLPFTEDQLSTAKLIEAGIKISMALNPALRIMRIKDGSLLDSDTLAIIKQAAKDNDYQLFIERVSDSKEIGFVIEE
jgi:DNA repair exonuclease SbcCD ATPase subunit